MKRSEKALKYFSNGFNCAQSVITSFADVLNIEEETALKIASGFGGGMGHMQETCGAVTGAYMVIGYLKGKYNESDNNARDVTNNLIQDFTQNFIEKHKSTTCKVLIDLDFNTDEGNAKALKEDVYAKKCTMFIEDSVCILEDILLQNK